jgi:HEAT repeat protein
MNGFDGGFFEPGRLGRPTRDLARMVKEMEENGDVTGLFEIAGADYPLPTRRAAIKALAQLAGPENVPAMLELAEKETDRAARISLINGFGRIGHDISLPYLIRLFKDKEPLMRVEAAGALSRFNSETAFSALLSGLARKSVTEDYLTRQYSAEALGKHGDRRAVFSLVAALKDPNGFVRAAAASALGNLGDRSAIESLQRARHTTPHPPGSDCAECQAIDTALLKLAPPKDR